MKRLILVLLLIPSVAIGAPFLISDPVDPLGCGASGQPMCPVSADVLQDGVVVASEIPLQSDMSIKYDLVSMPTSEYTYTAIYRDEIGRVSIASNPYLLLETALPPLNVRVIP